MFRFLCKELIQHRAPASTSCHVAHVCFLQTESLKSNSKSANQQFLTTSYLQNSCGFSLKLAISASKRINIRSTKKSDSVLELFRTHGFTQTDIKNFITKRPVLLLAKPDKTLNPKIEFFKSLGISMSDLSKILSKEPLLLLRGLESQIITSFNFLRTFVHSDKNLVSVLKKSHQILQYNLEKTMGPNISTLRTHGVPDSNISKLIMIQPSTLMLKNNRLEESIRIAKKLGFDPTSLGFILAVRTMMVLSDSTLERKMEVYRSFGLSGDEILSAFKLQPMCLLTSERKVRKLMDFFMNKLDWKPSVVTKCPNLLLLSLEKRIIPRCSVLQVLMSKGLVKKDINVRYLLKVTEKVFLERFVIKYGDKVPEVVMAHQGKLDFQGFLIDSKDMSS